MLGKRQTEFVTNYSKALFFPNDRKMPILRLIPRTFGVFIEGILPGDLKLFNYGLSTLRMKIASEEIILKFLLKFVN